MRLSAVLDELFATQDSRQKMMDDIAACNGELESLRRRMMFDRDFRRHVELTRQLNEARKLNEQLQRKFDGARGVVTLSADGKLRRQTTSASGPLAVTSQRYQCTG